MVGGGLFTLIFIAFVAFSIYFIFKQIQFILVSVGLYKEMVSNQKNIIGLLTEIRDKSEKSQTKLILLKKINCCWNYRG